MRYEVCLVEMILEKMKNKEENQWEECLVEREEDRKMMRRNYFSLDPPKTQFLQNEEKMKVKMGCKNLDQYAYYLQQVLLFCLVDNVCFCVSSFYLSTLFVLILTFLKNGSFFKEHF